MPGLRFALFVKFWVFAMWPALRGSTGRPENCFVGGDGMGTRRRRRRGGVREMGFRARPFVLCKDGGCHQRRRNTNFGPEKFFSRKNFPHICVVKMISATWAMYVGVGPPPPPPGTASAWSHLLQTPWMARMVLLQHRTEVLMAGVAGWGPEGAAWVPAHMPRAYHEALGKSFQSADPKSISARCCMGSPSCGERKLRRSTWHRRR